MTENALPLNLKALRGATLVTANTVEAMSQAVSQMLNQLMAKNQLQPQAIISAFFTVTSDLTAVSVAKIARTHCQFGQTPMLCAVEPEVEGLPPLCARVLLHVYLPQNQPVEAVYINGAEVLRPDLGS